MNSSDDYAMSKMCINSYSQEWQKASPSDVYTSPPDIALAILSRHAHSNQAIAIGVGSLPRIIAAATSAWVLFMALARFFNAIPISRRHSWAFSFGGSCASDRRSIVFSKACWTFLFNALLACSWCSPTVAFA